MADRKLAGQEAASGGRMTESLSLRQLFLSKKLADVGASGSDAANQITILAAEIRKEKNIDTLWCPISAQIITRRIVDSYYPFLFCLDPENNVMK